MGKDNKMRRGKRLISVGRKGCLVAAVASVLGMCALANAFEIPSGNEDLVIHFDNTFRYTLAQRLKGQDNKILNSVNNDDGDRNFDVGLVSSRLDLLSEFDAVYQRRYGIRLSGAGWYDPVYKHKLDNKSLATSNHLDNGNQSLGLASYTKDRYGGVDGELLDAFAFGRIDAGEVPINVRAGRHTIYWGEAFFPYAGTNGISYAQSPIDIGKALSMPGVELKEIFRPLNQVSATIQPAETLSFAGQYYLEWEANLFPEAGSYLGMIDPWLHGGEAILAPFGILPRGNDFEPDQSGEWGISTLWSPEWLDGTIGLYYRNFSDKMPQVLLELDAAGAPKSFHNVYADDIDLYGISFAKNILGVSVGAEFSYRENMPLMSNWLVPIGGPLPVPGDGDTAGARGNTMHALVNFLALLSKTPLYDSATLITEFTWGRWDKVTQGEQFFVGRDGYHGIDRVTRNAFTGAINFAPLWNQVFPGVDLAMPLSIASGLSGVSAVAGGGSKDNGSYSAGLSFDILAKYKVDLTYAGFFGTIHPDAAGQIAPPGLAGPGEGAGDIYGLLKDRDLLSLTLKTTF